MRLLSGVLAVFLLASPLLAADRPVRGWRFSVTDPSGGKNPRRRHVVAFARDHGVAVVGDPVANGVTLELSTTGASSATQAFVLPPGAFQEPNGPGWKGHARGSKATWVYVDERGENGPVTFFAVRGALGFLMKVVVDARGNNAKVALVPPNPGTGAAFVATVGGGDRYCAIFAAAVGAKVGSVNDDEAFSVRHARSRGACPSP